MSASEQWHNSSTISWGNHLLCGTVASLVAQMVKNLPAVQKPLCQEDPLEKGMATQLQYSCLENSIDRGAWRAMSMGSQPVRHDRVTKTHSLMWNSIIFTLVIHIVY